MTLFACDRCGVVYLVVPVDAECLLTHQRAPSGARHPAPPQACYGTVHEVPNAS